MTMNQSKHIRQAIEDIDEAINHGRAAKMQLMAIQHLEVEPLEKILAKLKIIRKRIDTTKT